MPSIKDYNDPSLDLLNKAKRRVNVRARKQASVLTGRLSVTAGDYKTFRQQQQQVLQIVLELSETIKLTEALTGPARVIDRFVALATSLGFQAGNLLNYISSVLNRSFNTYQEIEVKEIVATNDKTQRLFFELLETVVERTMGRQRGAANARRLFNEKVLELLRNTTSEMESLFQIVADAAAAYKQTPTGGMRNPLSDPEFKKMYMAMKRGGGSGVAGRTGMQFGFPGFLISSFPPRDTMDLQDLPRRFV